MTSVAADSNVRVSVAFSDISEQSRVRLKLYTTSALGHADLLVGDAEWTAGFNGTADICLPGGNYSVIVESLTTGQAMAFLQSIDAITTPCTYQQTTAQG